MPYRKRTRLWNNIDSWQPQPLCKRDCLSMNPDRTRHLEEAHQGGSTAERRRTQQTFRTTRLYVVPAELIEEIFTACDLEAPTASEGSNSENTENSI